MKKVKGVGVTGGLPEDHSGTNGADRPGRPWYTLDAVLLGGLALAYVVFFAALHLVAYRLGFGRDPSGQLTVFILVLVLLTTLDPKRCSGFVIDLDSGGTIEGWWPEAASWANAITRLDPSNVRLALDEDKRPAIQIGEMKHGAGL
jgi:hypothetical protein